MRVLVTGSEGFLGKVLIELLLKKGYEVVRYDLILGHDILDNKQLRKILQGCDVCIHLAAVADLYIAEQFPTRAQSINVDGTKLIVEMCDEMDIRLLYASTCCVYGNNDVEISNELSPISPTEHYARTKLEGENHVLNSKNGHTIMRIATFYGIGMRESLATAIFLRAAIEGKPIKIHGNGEQTRCFTHVYDISTGIICVMENLEFKGIVNISGNREISINRLADIAKEVSGNDVEIIYQSEREGQIFRSVIDNSLLRSMGWESTRTLRDGLKDCASIYSMEEHS